MHKWWRHCLLELRLLFGNPLFASLPVIYAILFMFMMLKAASVGGADQNMYSAAYHFHMLGHTMTLGPAMLIGILSIRRDVRRRSFEWNHSLPVSFATLLSAKYVVSVFYFSLFTLSTSVIFYALSISQGIAANIAMMYTMTFAVQYEVSYLVTLALAMLLGASIPNRIVYLIGFCAWMFGTFFMEIYIMNESRLYPARVFHLNQFFLQSGTFEYENWGYSLFSEEIQLTRWFVLAFTILLLAVCLLLLNRRRPTMFLKSGWIAVVGAFLLVAAASVPYSTLWAERYAQLDSKLEDPSISTADNPKPASIFRISSYEISLRRSSDDQLRVKARLKIPADELAGGDTLPLTLNRAFSLNRVLVEGMDAPYRRHGEKLTINLSEVKGNDIEAELIYTGKVMDFRADYSSDEFTSYSKGADVKLEGHAAWYPLPGYQEVYLKDNGERPSIIYEGWEFGRLRFSLGDMKLTVEGYPEPLYTGLEELERSPGYQLFEGKGVEQDISLYGGQSWTEVRRHDFPVTIITTPYLANSALSILGDLKNKHQYFAAWIPEFHTDLDSILYLGRGIERPQLEHSLMLSSQQYGYQISSLSGEWMNAMLFGNQSAFNYYYEQPELDVRGKISSLFWYLYYVEEKGLSDKDLRSAYGHLRSVQQILFKNGDGSDPQNKIGIGMAKQVRRAIEEGKGDQVKQLLVHFYQQGLMFPDTERNPWVEPENPIPFEEWQEQWDHMMNVK